jgi:hypothetical protein
MAAEIDLPIDVVLPLSQVAGDVANYCDHIEHCEPADIEVVRRAGGVLRNTGTQIAEASGRNPVELYAGRLGMIEQRNVLWHSGSYDGAAAALTARSWRALQLVQVEHDRAYHPDVIGSPKCQQLHHFALHLAKLAGSSAAVACGVAEHEDWLTRRVPDMLLFGVKLATVTGQKLDDAPMGWKRLADPAPVAGVAH